jgi:hypothetical protein
MLGFGPSEPDAADTIKILDQFEIVGRNDRLLGHAGEQPAKPIAVGETSCEVGSSNRIVAGARVSTPASATSCRSPPDNS